MKKILCCLLSLLLVWAALGGVIATAAAADEEDEKTEQALPTVVGTRVSLTEDFLIYFYIRLPEGADRQRAFIDGVTYTAEESDEAGVYVIAYPHLTLSTMTEELEVIPVCRLGSKTVKGLPYGFSVRDYATRLLAGGQVTPALRRVLIAMLNFGAAAQIYNEERIYNLANDYLAAEDKQIAEREYRSALAFSGEATQDFATLYSATMSIVGSPCFKIYIDLKGQETLRINGGSGFAEWKGLSQNEEADKLAEGVRLEIADNPAFENASSFRLEKLKKSEGYRVISTGIYANRYGQNYYIRLRTAEGVSQTLQYSVETYVARSLVSPVLTEEGRRLLLSMMAYGDAVCAYQSAEKA